MAGDIDIHEQAIIGSAGAPDDVVRQAAEVVWESEGVVHQYGPRLLIAAVDPDRAQEIERQVPGVTVSDAARAIPEPARGGLDEVGALGLEAFALRQSDEYIAAKARRPLDGEPWDSGEAMAPDLPAMEEPEAPVSGALPTGARLSSRVAVGIIIVEGPTAGLQFTAEERTQVVAEVQNGLTWLGSHGARAVTWLYDIQRVTLDVEPDSNAEALWRDPAMEELGFGTGVAGVRDYVDDMRIRIGPAIGYCGFVTKYPLVHFAYVPSIGGPYLVMHYDNDGWGPNNIDRVFAHETGHIFGAPDEYASSGCNCGGQWGFARWPNKNCETCAFNGGVACIMRSNDWQLCSHTPCHLGYDVIVPRVREWTEADAAEEIRKAGLTVRIIGPSGDPDAWVENQSPAGGTITGACDTVTVQLSTDLMR